MNTINPHQLTRFRRRLLLGESAGQDVEPPLWLIKSYEIFHRIVSNSAYPCYLGSTAERRGELYYTFVTPLTLTVLPKSLENFLSSAAQTPRERRNLTVFFAPDDPPPPHVEYQRRFWSILQMLQELDPQPWPETVPSDADHATWEFCFAGEPIFMFCAAPSYKKRSSRNLGPGMIMLMQPRRSFFGIEGDTRAGIEARRKTRERLLVWDGMPPHPDLGVYGESLNREWKQYFLPDDNRPVTGTCPLRVRYR